MDSAAVKCQYQSAVGSGLSEIAALGKATRMGFSLPRRNGIADKLQMVVCSIETTNEATALLPTKVRSCQILHQPGCCADAFLAANLAGGTPPLVPKTWKSIHKPRKCSSPIQTVRREVMDIPILESLWFPSTAVPSTPQPSGNSSRLRRQLRWHGNTFRWQRFAKGGERKKPDLVLLMWITVFDRECLGCH